MRRILCLVALFCVFAASPVFAVEVQVKGEFAVNFQYMRGQNFYESGWDNESEDGFAGHQRTRLQLDFIASEQLKGVLQFEIGSSQWGQPGLGANRGFGFDGDGVNVKTKHAYIDFMVPNTAVTFRVGLQPIALPAAFMGSNPILDNDVASVVGSIAITDNIAVTALWARPVDLDANNTLVNNSPDVDEFDVWSVIATIKMGPVEFKPWAALARAGKDAVWRGFGNTFADDPFANMLSPVARLGLEGIPSAYDGLGPSVTDGRFGLVKQQILQDQMALWAWWVGGATSIDLDPITITFDVMYGSAVANNTIASRQGLYVAGAVDYKMSLMTVGAFGWYSTGEDGDWRNGSEQLPMVSGSAAGFYTTTIGFHGSAFDDVGHAGLFTDGPAGKWAIGLVAKDISFIDDLSHMIKVVYMRGTNDPSSRRYTGLLEGLGVLAPGTANVVGVARPGDDLAAPVKTIAPGAVLDIHSLDSRPAFRNVAMTTNDYYWEVNFDHKYKLYENLDLIMETGFANLQYGEGSNMFAHTDTVTFWRGALGLKYTF